MITAAPLTAGLLGFGFAGQIFHAPFLNAAGFRIAAISTASPGRVALARAEYPDADVHASADEVIARDDLDLIVVATPNSSHTRLAIASLEAGHHVVLEKPIAPSVTEAESIIATAAAEERKLSVFQSRRFDSDFRTVRSVLASGELGELYRFESRYERWRPEVVENWRESADPADAGGLLFDLGSHLVDQFIALFGAPTSVYAELAGRRHGSRTDDDVFLALHGDRVAGQLWMSAVAADAGPRFRLLGSRAAFVKSGMDPQEEALLAGRRPPAPDWGQEPAGTYGRIGAGTQWRTVKSVAGDYTDFYSAMGAAIRGEGPVPVDPADSLAGLRVLHAARGAAVNGTVEPVR